MQLIFSSPNNQVGYPFATFDYKCNDPNPSNTATVSINVTNINHPPTVPAGLLNYTGFENLPLNITLSGSDPDSDPISFSVVSPPVRGYLYQYNSSSGGAGAQINQPETLVTDPNGQVVFVGELYQWGTNYDTLYYRVSDDKGLKSAIKQVNISLTYVPTPAQAFATTIATPQDSGVLITLSGKSVDSPLSALTFTVVTLPPSGSLYQVDINGNAILGSPIGAGNSVTDPSTSLIAKRVWYKPDPLVFGTMIFTFQVNDPSTSGQADVTVIVTAVNHPPVAYPAGYTINESTSVVILLNATDVDPNTNLTAIVSQLPTQGRLYNSSGVWIDKAYTQVPDLNVTYAPNQYGNGAPYDQFQFFVNDGALDSNTVVIQINVTAVPNPPTAFSVVAELDENTQPTSFSLFATDPDIGDILTATIGTIPDEALGTLYFGIPTGPTTTILGPPITANNTFVGTNWTLYYQPATGKWGLPFVSFDYTVFDGLFTSPSATVTINVKPFVLPPVVSPANITMQEDTVQTISLPGTDPNGFTISAIITVLPTKGILYQFGLGGAAISTSGTLVSDSQHRVNYAPVAHGYAIGDSFDSFEFLMDNGLATSADSALVTVWVTNVPTPAIVTTPNITILENGFADVTVDVFDWDLETNLTVSISTLPSRGKLYQTDGLGHTLQEITQPGTDLTLISLRPPPNTGTVSNRFIFVPDIYTFGLPYATFDISTRNGFYSTPATVTIWVTHVNNAPIVKDQNVTTDENNAITFALDVFDPDGDALEVYVTILPTRGTLGQTDGNNITIANSTVTDTTYKVNFIPDTFGNGLPYAMFQWTSYDGQVWSPTAVVTVNVNWVNQAPNALPVKATLRQDSQLVIGLGGFDQETPLDNLTAWIHSIPLRGKLYQADDGGTIGAPIVAQDTQVTQDFQVVFVPAPGEFGNAYAAFTYRMFDGVLYSQDAQVDITVTQNHAPTVDDQQFSMVRKGFSPITLTVKDVDKSDPLQAIITVLPTEGLLYQMVGGNPGDPILATNTTVLDPGFKVFFQPHEWEWGDDYAWFAFKAYDGLLFSANEAKVTITVTFKSFPPVPNNITVNSTEGDKTLITLGGYSPDSTIQHAYVSTLPVLGNVYQVKQTSRRSGEQSSGLDLGDQITVPGTEVLDRTFFRIFYSPIKYQHGQDRLGFKLQDSTSTSPESFATIDVPAINHAPELQNTVVTTVISSTQRILLAGFDGDGDPFTCRVTVLPTKGSLYSTKDGRTPDAAITSVPYNVIAGFDGNGTFFYPVTLVRNGTYVVFYQAPSIATNDSMTFNMSDNHNTSAVAEVEIAVEVEDTGSSTSATGAIVGATVGGVAVAGLAVAGFIFYRKRKDNYGALANLILGSTMLDELQKLLLEQDLSLVMAIGSSIQITEADEVAHALICIFEANKQSVRLLKAFVTKEVASSETPNTLFRSNSISTKLMKMYTKMIGGEYLKSTLKPLVDSLLASTATFEVDPHKIRPGQDAEENWRNLKTWAQTFFDTIVNSLNRCPYQFREVCSYLQAAVGERYPNFRNKHTFTGGFIFLRFFCPAVVAPEAFGISNAVIPAEKRRGLVLISKSLQNLSNGVQFGAKEPFMRPMNEFIVLNLKNVRMFLEAAATIPEGFVESQKRQMISFEDRNESLETIHRNICTFLDKIKAYISLNSSQVVLENTATTLEALLNLNEDMTDEICTVLTGNDKWVVTTLSNMNNNQDLAVALTHILEYKGKVVPILKHFITQEVFSCGSPNLLFRSNGMSYKILNSYVKMIVGPYLKQTLAKVVNLVCAYPDNFEIDPEKLGPDENLQTNVYKLTDTALEFLLAIVNSIKACPVQLRELYKHVQNEAGERYGDKRYTPLSSFVFTRLICPAIVSPEIYDITTEAPDQKARRALTLVAKMLQNLANGIELGKKEGYMAELKTFIENNVPILNDFFYNLVNVADGAYAEAPRVPIPREVIVNSAKTVHKAVVTARDKLTTSLLSDAKSMSNLMERLNTILEEMGPPKPRRRRQNTAPTVQQPASEP